MRGGSGSQRGRPKLFKNEDEELKVVREFTTTNGTDQVLAVMSANTI